MLELIDVAKDYPSPGKAGSFTVLKDITLKVSGGESLAVVGRSGSGKSTLLNIIGALDRPSRGKVLLDGNDLGKLGDSALAKLRSGGIGFVFQAPALQNIGHLVCPIPGTPVAFRPNASG